MSVRFRLIKPAKTILDVVLLVSAFVLAFLIRFEGSLPAREFDTLVFSLAYVIPFQFGCLLAFQIPRMPWRHVGIPEAYRILAALTVASGALVVIRLASSYFGNVIPPGPYSRVPLGVLLIDLVLSFNGLVSLRVGYRLWFPWFADSFHAQKSTKAPTLLIGAGSAGALVMKEILTSTNTGILPIGFLDDNPHKLGQRIHGKKVLGTTAQMAEIVANHGVQQALITIGNICGPAIRRIAMISERCGIVIKVIPGIREMVEGKINFSTMREIAIDDLLHRDPVTINSKLVGESLRSRRILVTGAGGSIGSELCREICRFSPATLVLVERAENNLFHIHWELAQTFPKVNLLPRLADICDTTRMTHLLSHIRPHMIFHAAAHKHVPMMEWNPGEAVKNNVLGTRKLADLACDVGVSQFVMISSDKAVNPTSVMGVTKSIAERYLQALAQQSATRFVTVRFGNVLGSNGSVVPIFQKQIARGGPVTITHPDMVRYFMTIPEACQLVLQAACMGRGGEIFILDMGAPVKILDLARDLIRLSGLAPNDIEIEFVGLRPGEKLFEELHMDEETMQPTDHYKIFISRLKPGALTEITRGLDELAALLDCGDSAKLRSKLKELVPEYQCPGVPHLSRSLDIGVHPPHSLAGLQGVDLGTGIAPGR